MFIEKLLQLMAEKKASDIFISAGSPISIKITGTIMPVNPQVMDAEACKKIIYEMLTPQQIETLEREQELNFSKPMAGLGNFRVNVFWQKGAASHGGALHQLRHPEDRRPEPAAGALLAGDGEARPDPGGGRDRLGQVHDARLDAGLPQLHLARATSSPSRTRSSTSSPPRNRSSTSARSATTRARSTTRCATPCARRPDCILIGEIRDLETMRMALTYALSGHLCLATLHANNAYQAMNRVISFFPLEVRPMLLQDLSVSLKAVISQRLIKTLDGKRAPAVEVLLNTRNIQELIEKGEITEIKEAMEKSMSPGSQTFEQDLFRLVRQGKISTDEALANADSATNLGLLLGNSGIMPAASDRVKNPPPGTPGARPGSTFGDFKIEEPSEERLG